MAIHTDQMRVIVSTREVETVGALAKKLLFLVQKNLPLVPLQLQRHFCGVCVSFAIFVPLASSYTRTLYFYMASVEKERQATGY